MGKKTVLFKRSAMTFDDFGAKEGKAGIARLVGPDMSTTMGGGIATFDQCAVEWTVRYDELIVVLEGTFKLKAGDEMFEAKPGDVLWIPAETPLVYMGDKAVVFYSVYPIDWRKRLGLA